MFNRSCSLDNIFYLIYNFTFDLSRTLGELQEVQNESELIQVLHKL
jgi:hypothetical protein